MNQLTIHTHGLRIFASRRAARFPRGHRERNPDDVIKFPAV